MHAERVDGIRHDRLNLVLLTEATRIQRPVSQLIYFPLSHDEPTSERFLHWSCIASSVAMRLEKRRYRAPEKVGANHGQREGVRPPRSDSPTTHLVSGWKPYFQFQPGTYNNTRILDDGPARCFLVFARYSPCLCVLWIASFEIGFWSSGSVSWV